MDSVMLRRAGLLAAWSSSTLRGETSAERAMDVVLAAAPVLVSLGGEQETFLGALGRWRGAGVSGWRYAPVAPGDAASLPGPSEFSRRAIEAGVALVADGGPTIGLLPDAARGGHVWLACQVDGRGLASPDSPADAERWLLEAVTEAAETLEALDVAGQSSGVVGLLSSWSAPDPVPPGWDSRAERLAARSTRVLELVQLAEQDAGGSRTAGEASVRASRLRDLGRVARAAHAVAWNDGLRRPPTARRGARG